MHKRPDGTFTAVDLRDGCFGTATIMRIVAMFVPHNIFEDRAPDGARISRCVCADLQPDRTIRCINSKRGRRHGVLCTVGVDERRG